MPIRVGWDAQNANALLLTFDGNWTWEEFYEAGSTAREIISDNTNPVHIIHDMRTTANTAKSPILHFRHFALNMPANARKGLTVYIGATSYWRACIATFMRVYPDIAPDVVYVSDHESACIAILRKQEQLDILGDDDDDEAGV
jgi:hypothetical protein